MLTHMSTSNKRTEQRRIPKLLVCSVSSMSRPDPWYTSWSLLDKSNIVCTNLMHILTINQCVTARIHSILKLVCASLSLKKHWTAVFLRFSFVTKEEHFFNLLINSSSGSELIYFLNTWNPHFVFFNTQCKYIAQKHIINLKVFTQYL